MVIPGLSPLPIRIPLTTVHNTPSFAHTVLALECSGLLFRLYSLSFPSHYAALLLAQSKCILKEGKSYHEVSEADLIRFKWNSQEIDWILKYYGRLEFEAWMNWNGADKRDGLNQCYSSGFTFLSKSDIHMSTYFIFHCLIMIILIVCCLLSVDCLLPLFSVSNSKI